MSKTIKLNTSKIMSEVKKITKEQLTKIKEQQVKINASLTEIGFLETRKHEMLHAHAQLTSEIEETKSELEKEYGKVSINLEDGSYTEIVEEAVAE